MREGKDLATSAHRPFSPALARNADSRSRGKCNSQLLPSDTSANRPVAGSVVDAYLEQPGRYEVGTCPLSGIEQDWETSPPVSTSNDVKTASPVVRESSRATTPTDDDYNDWESPPVSTGENLSSEPASRDSGSGTILYEQMPPAPLCYTSACSSRTPPTFSVTQLLVEGVWSREEIIAEDYVPGVVNHCGEILLQSEEQCPPHSYGIYTYWAYQPAEAALQTCFDDLEQENRVEDDSSPQCHPQEQTPARAFFFATASDSFVWTVGCTPVYQDILMPVLGFSNDLRQALHRAGWMQSKVDITQSAPYYIFHDWSLVHLRQVQARFAVSSKDYLEVIKPLDGLSTRNRAESPPCDGPPPPPFENEGGEVPASAENSAVLHKEIAEKDESEGSDGNSTDSEEDDQDFDQSIPPEWRRFTDLLQEEHMYLQTSYMSRMNMLKANRIECGGGTSITGSQYHVLTGTRLLPLHNNNRKKKLPPCLFKTTALPPIPLTKHHRMRWAVVKGKVVKRRRHAGENQLTREPTLSPVEEVRQNQVSDLVDGSPGCVVPHTSPDTRLVVHSLDCALTALLSSEVCDASIGNGRYGPSETIGL